MVISADDLASFRANGYVVARRVASPETLRAAVGAIVRWLGVSLDEREGWYRLRAEQVGIVPIHHPQVFWDNRQLPRMFEAFREIYGTHRLWVSMDRGSFLPPLDRSYPAHTGWHRLHWDVDPREQRTAPLRVQGMLYLTDTPEEQGAFQCVPEIYRGLDAWLGAHAPTEDERLDVSGYRVVKVPGRAGDLVIWNALLPHASSENHGPVPRLTQYISMHPEGAAEERHERIENWREVRAPAWWRGWVGQPDPEPWPPATLTPLGRKLLGLDAW
jgi:Phytanoyl-CoA dioxygenase (PhyH)